MVLTGNSVLSDDVLMVVWRNLVSDWCIVNFFAADYQWDVFGGAVDFCDCFVESGSFRTAWSVIKHRFVEVEWYISGGSRSGFNEFSQHFGLSLK